MNIVHSNTTTRSQDVRDIMNSDQAHKVTDIMYKELAKYGYNESNIRKLLIDRQLKVNPREDRIEVVLRGKPIFNILVSHIKVGSSIIYDCDISAV